jgi:hypothetical protein
MVSHTQCEFPGKILSRDTTICNVWSEHDDSKGLIIGRFGRLPRSFECLDTDLGSLEPVLNGMHGVKDKCDSDESYID